MRPPFTGIVYPLAGIPYSMSSRATIDELCATLKIAVATLREAGVEFLLGGSVALWARGGPEPYKDLDVMVRPGDAEQALAALAAAGMRTERPPEEWLFKAWHDGVLLDVIFRPSGLELDDEVFARAQDVPILAVRTPVMSVEDVLVTKLMAMDERALDYAALVATARSLREQIDWEALHARTAHSPFARAFFVLVDGLGIAARMVGPGEPVPGGQSAGRPASGEQASNPRVRVVRE